MRIDTAVKPQRIDPVTGKLTGKSVVDTVYAIKIPKGTKVYTGPVDTLKNLKGYFNFCLFTK